MKRRILLICSFTFAALLLLGQGKDPQGDYDWSTYDFTPHFSFKNAGGKKTLASNKRIFIANFQIVQTLVANGKQMGSSNLAKMSVGMTPIDLARYQALVDKLYNQFKARLEAEGYTIVPDDEVANSDFAKKEHNGRSVYCQYVNEPIYAKDGAGNDVVYLTPANKFIVVNTSPVTGNWPTKFGKAIDATAITIALGVNSVSFDGSRGMGKKGASIEGEPNMTVGPWGLISNATGGFAVYGAGVDGKVNWLGPKGMSKADSKTDVFGSVRGTFVLDVKEDVYLSEVEAITSGLSNAFVDNLVKEGK